MTKLRIEISDLRLLTWSWSAFSGTARVSWRWMISAVTVTVIVGVLWDPSEASAQGPGFHGSIAGTAHANGAQGSVWRTDLYIHNADDQPVQVELTWAAKDKTPGTPLDPITIQPDATFFSGDAVAELFGKNGSGGLHWKVTQGDPEKVLVNSTTYNKISETERYGLNAPGIRWDELRNFPNLRAPVFPLNKSRTNVSFIANESCGEVLLQIIEDTGDARAGFFINKDPYVWWQITDIIPAAEAEMGWNLDHDSYHYVYAFCNGPDKVNGKLNLNTTPADNRSNDGTLFQSQDYRDVNVRASNWLSGVAFVGSDTGGYWVSDTFFIGNHSKIGQGQIDFINQDVLTAPFEVQPKNERVLPSILTSYFGLSPENPSKGALRVETEWPIMAFMRTFTTTANGSMGQAVSPVDEKEMVDEFHEGRIPGVSENPTTRGSLILQCARRSLDGEPLPCDVDVEVLGIDGESLDRCTISVEPYQFWQKVRYFKSRGLTDVSGVTIKVNLLPDAHEFYHGGLDARYSEVNGNTIPGTEDPRLVNAFLVKKPFADEVQYEMVLRLEYILDGQLYTAGGATEDKAVIATVLGTDDIAAYVGTGFDYDNGTEEDAVLMNPILQRLSTLRPAQLEDALSTSYAWMGQHNLDEALRDADADGWLVDGYADGSDWPYDDETGAPGNDPTSYVVRIAVPVVDTVD